MTVHPLLARRRAERDRRISLARDFVEEVEGRLPLRAAVVHGSVARGDFNLWSDIDVLLVSDVLPDRWQDRHDALPPAPAAVQPIVWTTREWRRQAERKNPIVPEATEHGVWLVGSAAELG